MSSSNNILGSKAPKNYDPTTSLGALPVLAQYIGIVKHNADPTRAGRLQVWIPDFSGNEEDKTTWITVRYASPFMGSTRYGGSKTRPADNTYNSVNHAYGMWFTPPDIGNYVLVTFIAGDITKGYWFACIMPELSQYGIPGMAGSTGSRGAAPFVDSKLGEVLTNPPYPCVEFNEDAEDLKANWNDFLLINKPVHEAQAKILLRQGLEDDKTRGVISSSSQRESPSRVFGISTPGAPSLERVASSTSPQPRYRQGGHTFVMDDGDSNGDDRLIRLRTSGGHQILMNDTEQILYIGNSTGSVWMEFTGDGQIHMFSESNLNIRAKGNINMHSDSSINICAADKIKMFASNSIQIESKTITNVGTTELNSYGGKVGISSGSTLGLQAGTVGSFGSGTELVFGSGQIFINQKPAPSVAPPANIPSKKFKDTKQTKAAPYYKWKFGGFSTTSIVDRLPTHEPWLYEHPAGVSAVNLGSTGAQPTATTVPTTPTTGDSAGPATAQGKGVGKKTASPSQYASETNIQKNTTAIGTLSKEEVIALKTQLANTESSFNYSAQNSIGYIGKYQFGVLGLEQFGYLKAGTSKISRSNKLVNDPANWTGKSGLTSKEAFWAARDEQEAIMDKNLAYSYNYLKSKGVITSSSSSDDVAGKLCVAHLLGIGGCVQWSKGIPVANNSNGNDADAYYNYGRYAIKVLAAGGTSDTVS